MVASTVGLGHLAAAAATPIVVPCEPTNPCESGPYSKHAWIVRAGFKCAPCYRQELRFGCGKMDCMSFITPQQVFEAVCETIAGVMPPPVPSLKTTNAFGPSI